MTDQVDLAAPSGGTKHKVTLTFDVKQDGQPFLGPVVIPYHNCSDAYVAAITGQVTNMASVLGSKGNKPKGGSFSVVMELKVDDAVKAGGTWDGLTREQALAYERHVLEEWLHASEGSVKANKAAGKI